MGPFPTAGTARIPSDFRVQGLGHGKDSRILPGIGVRFRDFGVRTWVAGSELNDEKAA